MAADERTMVLQLTNDVASVRTARSALQAVLGDEPTVMFVRDAILLTSELVSNAMMHSAGGCSLHATYRPHPDRLRVEVSDDSTELPEMAPDADPSSLRVGGLGLRLVDTVATRWGCDRRDDGKVVWFELG